MQTALENWPRSKVEGFLYAAQIASSNQVDASLRGLHPEIRVVVQKELLHFSERSNKEKRYILRRIISKRFAVQNCGAKVPERIRSGLKTTPMHPLIRRYIERVLRVGSL